MLYNDRYCRPPPERAIPDGEREARYFFLIFVLFYLFILKQLNKWKDGGGKEIDTITYRVLSTNS